MGFELRHLSCPLSFLLCNSNVFSRTLLPNSPDMTGTGLAQETPHDVAGGGELGRPEIGGLI